MKKIIFSAIAFIAGFSLFAQSGQKFATGGNSLSTGDFLGSTNSYPLIFKTNSTAYMSLSTTGVLQLNNFSGKNTRMVQTDANGNLIFLQQGLSTQYLNGIGQWINFPQIPSALWTQTGSGIFYSGNVGINNPHPQFALDITGDLNVTNNVYVGGGVLISQKIQASASLKTDSVHSVTGKTSFTSPVKLHSQFEVVGNSVFNGSVSANNIGANSISVNSGSINNLSVGGTATLNQLNINSTLTSNNVTISSLAGNSGGGFVYADSLGNLHRPSNPNTITHCITNAPWMTGGNSFGYTIGAVIGTCDINPFVMVTNNIERMTITSAGNIHVGIQYPQNTPFNNALFTVNGQMVAKEMYVEVTDWADYVFKKDYKLMPLSEVEKYYRANQHLPEVPSEKEVKEKGLNVGDMNTILLKKIEELTIYTVELEKKLKALEEKVNK